MFLCFQVYLLNTNIPAPVSIWLISAWWTFFLILYILSNFLYIEVWGVPFENNTQHDFSRTIQSENLSLSKYNLFCIYCNSHSLWTNDCISFCDFLTWFLFSFLLLPLDPFSWVFIYLVFSISFPFILRGSGAFYSRIFRLLSKTQPCTAEFTNLR